MSTDLANELQAINSIYGANTLTQTSDPQTYILTLPTTSISLRLTFHLSYPLHPPQITGIETTGPTTPKGQGHQTLTLARTTLYQTFTPGTVCLFDLLQDLATPLPPSSPPSDSPPKPPTPPPEPTPTWTLSPPLHQTSSLFLAHATPCPSSTHAATYLTHLLTHNTRVAKATHNISAYRIRSPACPTPGGHNPGGHNPGDHNPGAHTPGPSNRERIHQSYNDDGETGAGRRLLGLLEVMGCVDVLVVVSRWYGGVKMGPARFRAISGVAREALLGGRSWGGGRDRLGLMGGVW